MLFRIHNLVYEFEKYCHINVRKCAMSHKYTLLLQMNWHLPNYMYQGATVLHIRLSNKVTLNTQKRIQILFSSNIINASHAIELSRLSIITTQTKF